MEDQNLWGTNILTGYAEEKDSTKKKDKWLERRRESGKTPHVKGWEFEKGKRC